MPRANRLALIRPFCVAAGLPMRRQSRPVHNYFRGAEADGIGRSADVGKCASRARKRVRAASAEKSNVTKTLISSALLPHDRLFARQRRPLKIFRRSATAARMERAVQADGSGAYTQN